MLLCLSVKATSAHTEALKSSGTDVNTNCPLGLEKCLGALELYDQAMYTLEDEVKFLIESNDKLLKDLRESVESSDSSVLWDALGCMTGAVATGMLIEDKVNVAGATAGAVVCLGILRLF